MAWLTSAWNSKKFTEAMVVILAISSPVAVFANAGNPRLAFVVLIATLMLTGVFLMRHVLLHTQKETYSALFSDMYKKNPVGMTLQTACAVVGIIGATVANFSDNRIVGVIAVLVLMVLAVVMISLTAWTIIAALIKRRRKPSELGGL